MPILLVAFKRIDTTNEVFKTLSLLKPQKLYFAVDGPRAEVPGEVDAVDRVRNLISLVDWPCDIHTRFLEDNAGGPFAVSSAITWLFEHEEMGIILEDDTIPHLDFFQFCSQLLGRYENDDSVWTITGDNFQLGTLRGDGSYYFSKYPHCWGWATWKRAWDSFDLRIPFWPDMKTSDNWRKLHPDVVERRYWERIFNAVYSAEKIHWDYAWLAAIWWNQGKTITPNVNMVTNIGFGAGASNCVKSNSPFANMEKFGLAKISEPGSKEIDVLADEFDFNWHFRGSSMRFPKSIYYHSRRLLGNLYKRYK